jgi:diacylglycerol kinase (ATP)
VTREIALLVNPTAGKGLGGRLAGPVAERLRAHGNSVDVILGRDADEAFDVVRNRVAQGVDSLVTVGGDGLVNMAIQVVAGTSTPLGIVPAGTGNDFARALGIPLGDAVAAVDLAAAVPPRRVDVGRAAGRWFGCVLSSGFDSMVNERANRMNWPNGRSRYNIAMVAELRTFRPIPFVLELDDETWETEAMLVAVGNGSSYGGGMRVCPDARLDDGLLNVTVLGPISKADFVRLFPKVYSGEHVNHPSVTVRQATCVSLAAQGVTAYADGERVAALPLTCDVVPGALQVLAPPDATPRAARILEE